MRFKNKDRLQKSIKFRVFSEEVKEIIFYHALFLRFSIVASQYVHRCFFNLAFYMFCLLTAIMERQQL